MVLRLSILFALLASPLPAGPWPRAEGERFLALSVAVAGEPDPFSTTAPETYSSAYFEYGVDGTVTTGIALGQGEDEAQAFGFLRHPVGSTGGDGRAAVELGLGWRGGAARTEEPILRPALALGRGFANPLDGGWLTLDLSAAIGLDSGDSDIKADLTAGLRASEDLMFMLQLFNEGRTGEPVETRLAPSLAFAVAEDTHVQLGVTTGLRGDRRTGVSLSLWSRF